MGVGGDLVIDGESECESGTTCLGGNAGLRAGAHGVEEVFKLKAKGFAFGDVRVGEGEACGGVLTVGGRGRVGGGGKRGGGGCRAGRSACSDRRCDDGRIDADGQEFLAGEVEREVLVGLEETKLAHLLGGDAAGGEVGDATGVEFDAHVGDVGFGGEDREANGADFADGGVGEAENDVEIVDHEIENDVDVERTRGEDAEPVRLEEHGVRERGEGGGDGGVEALEVADGDDACVGLREGEDVVGLGEGGGEGLLDEEVEAGEEKLLGDVGVVGGGDADRGGIERQVGGEEFGDGGEGGDVVGSGVGGAALGEGVDERCELDELRQSEFEFAIDAQVITPEGAGTDDGDAYG